MAKKVKQSRYPGIRWREDRQKYQASVVVAYAENGTKKRTITKYFLLEHDALAWREDQNSKVRKGQLSEASNMPLKDWIAEYLENKRTANRAATTVYHYEKKLERYVTPYLGDVPLNELSPVMIQRWTTKLAAKRSAAVIVEAHHRLKLVLEEAVSLELIQRNPAKLVKVAKPKPRALTRWSPEEAKKVILFALERFTQIDVYVILGLMTAMRREELLGLTWPAVNLETGEIDVCRSLVYVSGKPVFRDETKNAGSKRTLFASEIALEVLRGHQQAQLEMQAVAGEKWRDLDLIFTNLHGGPVREGTLNTEFHALCDAAKVTHIRPYDLRATWASNAAEAGEETRLIADILGHRSINQTLTSYIRSRGEQKRSIGNRTPNLYGLEIPKPDPAPETSAEPDQAQNDGSKGDDEA